MLIRVSGAVLHEATTEHAVLWDRHRREDGKLPDQSADYPASSLPSGKPARGGEPGRPARSRRMVAQRQARRQGISGNGQPGTGLVATWG